MRGECSSLVAETRVRISAPSKYCKTASAAQPKQQQKQQKLKKKAKGHIKNINKFGLI